MSIDNGGSLYDGSFQQGSLYQGSSTLHSSLCNSLLLQPTGRILRHRVREETRERVRESTQSLEDSLKIHNKRLRKEFEDKFINRVKKFEAHRHLETKKWELKTAHSPFHTDLLKADAEMFEKVTKVRKEKQRLQAKYDKLDAMSGKPRYDVVSDDVIEKASSQLAQLALKRRVIQGDLRVTQREFSECDKMLFDEFLVLERKFPAIRDKLMQSREGSVIGNSYDSARNSESNHVYTQGNAKTSGAFELTDGMKYGSMLENGELEEEPQYVRSRDHGALQDYSFAQSFDTTLQGSNHSPGYKNNKTKSR